MNVLPVPVRVEAHSMGYCEELHITVRVLNREGEELAVTEAHCPVRPSPVVTGHVHEVYIDGDMLGMLNHDPVPGMDGPTISGLDAPVRPPKLWVERG